MFAAIARVTLAGAFLFGLAAAGRAQTIKVTVGMTGTTTDVGLYVADKKGFFRDEGLNVTLTTFDSAARMITLFASGELDVGGGGPSAGLYNAVARGVDIRIVADKNSTPPGRGAQFLLVRKDLVDSGRYNTIADLKGLKVASPALGGASTTTLDKIFEKAGISVDEVERVFMGVTQQIVALQNKAVDASLMAEPLVSEAVKLGIAVRVLNDDDVYPYHQVAVILYSGQFARNRPDAARRFMRAYLRAIRAYSDGIVDNKFAGPAGEEMIAILSEYSQLKDRNTLRAITPAALDPDGRLNVASLKEDLDIFRRQKLIEGNVTVEQAVDASFAEWAAKDLGPYKPASAK